MKTSIAPCLTVKNKKKYDAIRKLEDVLKESRRLTKQYQLPFKDKSRKLPSLRNNIYSYHDAVS